ncbi:serpin B6 [Bombina bombina]|uniref:serpin B6 n=1 Tax=Bombina bombina TaxID=8345 RepID=UPI00235A97E6|nr:serpin B6 [Bombina bombina]XP_053570626.1 serpin B6 [Bombina bombina]
MDSVISSNNTFALDLFKKLSEGNSGQNIFFSPMSISSALAMVYLGAKGNTGYQMSQVLQFNQSGRTKGCFVKKRCTEASDQIHEAFQELLSDVNQPSCGYLLKTANKLFSENNVTIVTKYLELLQKYYHADVQAVNFLEEAENARKTINSWVEGQTEGKIQDILPSGSVDSLTRLILVNAIYFKGNWETKFPPENTEEKPFRMNKTTSKLVQMMYQRSTFKTHYIDDLETTLLELPYVNNKLSMILLLPDEIKDDSTGLEQLEKELSYKKLQEWTKAGMMVSSEVEVDLPQIHLEESYDLKATLSSMGLLDLFSAEKADLTGISDKRNIYLSQAFHKSFVEINEEGTEAAAATAGIIIVRSAPMVVRFVADHPFLFFIRHNKTNSILFAGKFCSP